MLIRFLLLAPILTSTLMLVSACSRVSAQNEAAAPSVNGSQIVFPANSPQRSAIESVVAQPRGLEIRRLSGRVTWDEEATVRIYTPVAGRVASVAVALGDHVEKDAVLLQIASPDFGQAQADAHKANADLLLAERTFARSKNLFEHGALARKDLEAAEAAQAGAESEQHRAIARLKLYGSVVEDVDGLFALRSPLAGTVVEKNINLGQEVRSDQLLANAPQLFAPLLVISDPTRLRLLIDAPERELSVLKPGVHLMVRSMAIPEQTFSGQIDGVSDSLDPTTHTLTVRGRVENPERRLKAEMFVSVEFTINAPSGVEIPIKAVFMKSERHFVYVETQSGAYERREVEIGAEHDGKILVGSGLTAGEQVVTEGGLLLDELRGEVGETK